MTEFDPRGTTAIVTGASSGFGAEFARRLAARGADLVVVARRADRLAELADELRARHGVAVTTVPLDLSLPTAATDLRDALDGVTVSTLVNNAGFGSHGDFIRSDAAREREQIEVNVQALVALTHDFLPDLVASAGLRAGSAALVNVASNAAFQPVPRMAVYGATKAFVLSFSEAVWYETRATGLKVTALCPGPASTEFFDVAKNEDAAVGAFETAEQVVQTAFAALDRRHTPPSTVSGLMNRVQAAAVGFVPRSLVVRAVGRLGQGDD
jgi:short-subunit dehydrogenase